MGTSFALRPSITRLPLNDSPVYEPPSSSELLGEWFIVLTSLPYWLNKRNIKITYSEIPSGDTNTKSIQDDVTYQTSTSGKIKAIRGINTPSQSGQPGAWNWRGCGLIKVVSNHWEVLAHEPLQGRDRAEWIVIHTGKSLFAPAAVHVYSRTQKALAKDVRDDLTKALAEHQDLKETLETMVDVQHG